MGKKWAMFIGKYLPITVRFWVRDSSMHFQASSKPEVLLDICDHKSTKRDPGLRIHESWCLLVYFWFHILPLDEGVNTAQPKALGNVILTEESYVSISSNIILLTEKYLLLPYPYCHYSRNPKTIQRKWIFRISFITHVFFLFSLPDFLSTVATTVCVCVGGVVV